MVLGATTQQCEEAGMEMVTTNEEEDRRFVTIWYLFHTVVVINVEVAS